MICPTDEIFRINIIILLAYQRHRMVSLWPDFLCAAISASVPLDKALAFYKGDSVQEVLPESQTELNVVDHVLPPTPIAGNCFHLRRHLLKTINKPLQ